MTIISNKYFNKYLAAIKVANDEPDYQRSREMLRRIYAQMVAQYGVDDKDVDYLYRQFRHNI